MIRKKSGVAEKPLGKRHAVGVLSLVVAALCAPDVYAQSSVIDDVEVKTAQNRSELVLDFTTQLQYLNHTPLNSGRELQIQFRPVRGASAVADIPSGEQFVNISGIGADDAREITYELDSVTGNIRFIVRFNRKLEYTVRPESGFRGVIIEFDSGTDQAPEEAVEGMQPEQQTGQASQQKTPLQATETSQAAAVSRPVADEKRDVTSTGSIILNLVSSIKPIDLSTVDRHPLFKGRHLHINTATVNGQKWYRLSLGYYATLGEAKGAQRALQGEYPTAWITRVSRKGMDVSTPSTAAEVKPSKVAEKPTRTNLLEVGTYVVNLGSSARTFNLDQVAAHPSFAGHQLYTTLGKVDGKSWHRLRIGFFKTPGEARKIQQALSERFPKAWITKASRQEIETALNTRLTEPRRAAKPATIVKPVDLTPLPPKDEASIKRLMEDARKAMAAKSYQRAIQLYTKVLRYPEHAMKPAAQEFLGLARERNKQLAHAKAEYERYLTLYPEGDGAGRVRQRLEGLLTARAEPKQRLRTAKRAGDEQDGYEWRTFGSFSQFYRRDAMLTDEDEERVTQSSLSTDLDISTRARKDDYEFGLRFTGGYTHDFLEPTDDDSDMRVSSMYADLGQRDVDLSARIGRQTRSTGGVLGRFDGGLVSYRLNKQMKFNFVTGYPVNSSSDSPSNDRWFWGGSLDLGTYNDAWDFVVFYINQRTEGIQDRQAIGGEFRYFDPEQTLFGLFDYDIDYGEVNIFSLIGNWKLPDEYSLNAQFDYRRSPLLTSTNALQGQAPLTNIDQMLQVVTEDRINSLAEDVSALSYSFTAGLSKPLTDKLQLSGDVTYTEFKDTKNTNVSDSTVTFNPGTGIDSFYNIQLIGSDLIKPGDISVLGMRYSDTNTTDTVSLSLNTRYPYNTKLRLNPRLRVDYRERSSDDSIEWVIVPSLRLDYRWERRNNFELEVGGEWSETETSAGVTDTDSSYYLGVGYRIDF